MRVLTLFLLVATMTSCDLLQSDHNTYPDAESELRVFNKTDLDVDFDIIHNGVKTSYSVNSESGLDFDSYPVGPQLVYVRNGSDTLITLKDAYLEFGKPSTFYIYGNSQTRLAGIYNQHEKTYQDSTAKIKFLNGFHEVDAVDVYYSYGTTTTKNDSIFFSDEMNYFADMQPAFTDSFDISNFDYQSFRTTENFSVVVTEAENENNVLLNSTIEIKPQISKTLFLNSDGVEQYLDQY